jgi:hypothetical protein
MGGSVGKEMKKIIREIWIFLENKGDESVFQKDKIYDKFNNLENQKYSNSKVRLAINRIRKMRIKY